MDGNALNSISNLEKVSDWYSEDFIRQSMIKFLKLDGYTIHKLPLAARDEKLIVATRFFKKELIEIKGFPRSHYTSDITRAAAKNDNLTQQAKRWFSEALFNSLVNFANYYSEGNVIVALALPNAGRYKIIIERVQEYFTLNNLYLKFILLMQTEVWKYQI
jgi:hypothetical protein